MSFKAVLKIAGHSIDIDYLDLDINQAVDARSRPASLARGGIMTVEFDTPSDNDMITDWMANPVKQLDGSIIFKNQNQDSTMKTINFYNAYCINFMERFDGTMDSSNMKTTITISPERINIGGVELDNKWIVSGTGKGDGSKGASDKSSGKAEEKPTAGLKSTALAAKVPTPCDNVKTSTDMSKTKKVRYTARTNTVAAANQAIHDKINKLYPPSTHPYPPKETDGLYAPMRRFTGNNAAIERAKLADDIYVWEKEKLWANEPGKYQERLKALTTTHPPEGWRIVEPYKKDPKTGFASAVYVNDFEPNAKPVLVYRGTDNADEPYKDWIRGNLSQGRGVDTPQYNQTVLEAQKMKAKYGAIEVTGHSKAGGQAAAAGVVTGSRAYTFNAAGVHSETLGRFGKKREQGVDILGGKPLVQAYNFPGEILTYAQSTPEALKRVLSPAGGLIDVVDGYNSGSETGTNIGDAVDKKLWGGFGMGKRIGGALGKIGGLGAGLGRGVVNNVKNIFSGSLPQAIGERRQVTAQDINGNPIPDPGLTGVMKRVDLHGMPYLINSMEKEKKDDLKKMADILGCK
jgi:Hemolysin coregulated protein Hcp (TssD)